jgi:hypothetical protein
MGLINERAAENTWSARFPRVKANKSFESFRLKFPIGRGVLGESFQLPKFQMRKGAVK